MRIGEVTAIDAQNRRCRVYLHDVSIMSGWLTVLNTGTNWMPAIGDKVAIIYSEGFNADGYVIGGIT